MPTCFESFTKSSVSSETRLAVDLDIGIGNELLPKLPGALDLEAPLFQPFENQHRPHRPEQHRWGQAARGRACGRLTGETASPDVFGIRQVRRIRRLADARPIGIGPSTRSDPSSWFPSVSPPSSHLRPFPQHPSNYIRARIPSILRSVQPYGLSHPRPNRDLLSPSHTAQISRPPINTKT